MDLRQTDGAADQRPGRRIAFELLLAIALSVGCWYTYFSMFPNPVDPVVSALLIAGVPVGLYFLCWNPFLGRFLVFYVFLLTAIFFVLAYESVWNGLLVMANIVIEVINEQVNAGWIPFEVTGDTVDWARDVFMAMIPVMLLSSMGIAHSVYHKEPLLGFILTAIPVMLGLCLKAEPSCMGSGAALSELDRAAGFVRGGTNRGKKKNGPIYIQNKKNSTLPYLFLGLPWCCCWDIFCVFRRGLPAAGKRGRSKRSDCRHGRTSQV